MPGRFWKELGSILKERTGRTADGEQCYAELVKSQAEEAAKAYLTDYTKDFIGKGTLLRWDEMTAKYWNDYRFGF